MCGRIINTAPTTPTPGPTHLVNHVLIGHMFHSTRTQWHPHHHHLLLLLGYHTLCELIDGRRSRQTFEGERSACGQLRPIIGDRYGHLDWDIDSQTKGDVSTLTTEWFSRSKEDLIKSIISRAHPKRDHVGGGEEKEVNQ